MEMSKIKNLWYDTMNTTGLIEQDHRVISDLINIVERLKPNLSTIAEIGVNKGGTLNLWRHLITKNGTLIAIDITNHANYNDQRIKFIEGNSTHYSTYEKFLNFLSKTPTKEIDFLFIDGGHSLNEVLSDFFLYGEHVRKSGLIAFHDIMLESGNSGSSKEFWSILKDRISNRSSYETRYRIIYETSMHTGMGIIEVV